jgi:hypothetical protein
MRQVHGCINIIIEIVIFLKYIVCRPNFHIHVSVCIRIATCRVKHKQVHKVWDLVVISNVSGILLKQWNAGARVREFSICKTSDITFWTRSGRYEEHYNRTIREGPEYCSQYSDLPPAGQSGDRIRAEARFFAPVPRARTSTYKINTLYLSRG